MTARSRRLTGNIRFALFGILTCRKVVYIHVHGRPIGINKVVYANMVVDSAIFRCPAVLQVGLETMLYHSTFKIPVTDILRHSTNDARFKRLFVTDYIVLKISDLGGHNSYILSVADVKETRKQRTSETENSAGSSNPVAEYFARKHCTHLEDSQLAVLADGTTLGRIGPVEAVRDFVEHLINR